MLKAGFARLDVTPPLGVPLAGYYEKRIADGVLDPIQVNAVAVAKGGITILELAERMFFKHLCRF
jgi:hypothetical protein